MRGLFLLLAVPLLHAERVSVPLRDPARPAMVKVSTVNGNIQVRAHSGKEVIVDTEEQAPRTQSAPNGMKQILSGRDGVSIEEENNVVTVKSMHGGGSYVVLVPEKSSVHLKSVNAKELRIEGVEGEIEAETANGAITIVNAAGPVVAHSLNGRLTASFTRVAAGKPMSFSTLNGRIDVTLPAAAQADLRISNRRGETYSDFELAVTTAVTRSESGMENGPKYKLNMEHVVSAKLNGGGPEISLRSLNGKIYIRKAK